MGSTASGGVFIARDAVARAHDSARVATALAHSHAAQRGGRKASLILRKFEMGLWPPRIIARAKAKVFVQLVRLDQFARIHLPVGIPERLELTKGLHEFRAKHLREKFTARLSVSMFARERAAVADDEVGGLFHELAEFAHAFGRFQIVIHAGVDAGVAEVPIK